LDSFSTWKDQQLAVGSEARSDLPGELSKNTLGSVPLNGTAQSLPHDNPDARRSALRAAEHQIEQRSLDTPSDSFNVFDIGA
jgi:hypothetical protein